MNGQQHGLIAFLQQTDEIGLAVALLLAGMSVLSVALIVLKTVRLAGLRRRGGRLANRILDEADLSGSVSRGGAGRSGAFWNLALAGVQAAQGYQRGDAGPLANAMSASDYITRGLRRGLAAEQSRIESGLAVLASIGSTAPFVGLFGTVWGIYHALLGISASGQATIDKVAGPVGEALIMTALGLAVAIPAVLAYNALLRSSRLILSDLDAFAHDLHARLVGVGRAGGGVPSPALQRSPSPSSGSS